ncbi:hypothetical protein [Streptomyces olivochromogenes]|uniref:hypothetical protein n=1 Tax=Streptomyces olivochromogenes TaxID=1963 RepID=UPI001F2FD6E9|nr:hypothetical protein [Streptomyces olivochromogenes]MCF3133824.1 hypothetical protein [Streptomyces olivochromogenes]
MVFNLVSLVLSIVAVVASTWGISRQVARARADSDLSMTTELLLTHVRDAAFQQDQLWVLSDLPHEYGPENGIEGLPYPANYRLWNVGIVYESVAIMLRFDLTNPVILLSLAQHRLIRTWETMQPYIEAERAKRGRVVFPFFEDAYVFAKEVDANVLYREIALRHADGSLRSAVPGAAGPGRQFARQWRRWAGRREPRMARAVRRLRSMDPR